MLPSTVMSAGGQLWRFRAPIDQIGYVRSIVEAYEGLAVVSSEAGRSIVTWWVAPGREDEARTLAGVLAAECGLQALEAK